MVQELKCPCCDSPNIKSFHEVFEKGYKSDAKDYTISDLAKELAPPTCPSEPVLNQEKKSIMGWIWTFIAVQLVFVVLALISNVIISLFTKYKFYELLDYIFSLWPIAFIYIVYKHIKNNKQRKNIYELEMNDYKEEVRIFKESYKHWCNSYICMRCGNKFFLETESDKHE